MAMLRKAPAAPATPRRRMVVASAARYTFGGAQAWKGTLPAGDRRWQIEAWRQYDMCGELRYATGWKANACSQAILYVADIDPDTGQPVGPTENETIRKIAGGILGGPVKRQQHIRTMVLNIDVAGEIYTIVSPNPKRGQPDVWLVVSGTEMNQQGSSIEYTHPDTGVPVKVENRDNLIRIWVPHPRLQLAADSAVRAALPTLREIEKSSQNIAARLDSRLAGAGIMTVPSEADLPTTDDSEAEETSSLTEVIFDAMRKSLADPGSAGAQVPLIFEVPAEFADAFRHITLETPLSKEVVELREKAIGRLAAALDLPREVVEGMGDSNHWSAWQVAEETYRTHLVPILDVIADALTIGYLHPIAIAAGIPEDEVNRYAIAFDGSALIGEPDPTKQALELYDRGLITAEAVLRMLHIPEDYAPTGDEKLYAIAVQIVSGAPTLFDQPALRRILGFEDATAPAVEPAPAPAAPGITASAAVQTDTAHLAVLYALERAGNRLLQTQRLKAEYAGVPRHELHVRLRPDDRHGDLLEGAWRHIPEFAARWDLDRYCRTLIDQGAPHSTDILAAWMARRDQ